MTKLLFAGGLFLSLMSAGAARADDFLARNPPPAALSWTGFYVGANGGYFNQTGTQVTGTPLASFGGAVDGLTMAQAAAVTYNFGGPHGGLIGGQIGYNRQIASTFVAGIEFSGDVFLGNRSCTGGGFPGAACAVNTNVVSPDGVTAAVSNNTGRTRADNLFTLLGRVGYLPLPSVLVYGTGGLAVGRTSSTFAVAQSFPGTISLPSINAATNSETRVGYAAGGGVEWKFAKNWSVKGEGLYYQLSSFQTAVANPRGTAAVTFGNGVIVSNTRPQGVMARAGLNYQFDLASLGSLIK